MRRARWLRLGLHDRAGFTNASGSFASPGIAGLQRQIQNHANLVRDSISRGPGHHRIDGSCARAVRAPVVVLAESAQYPRKRKTLRTHSSWFSDEQTRALFE